MLSLPARPGVPGPMGGGVRDSGGGVRDMGGFGVEFSDLLLRAFKAPEDHATSNSVPCPNAFYMPHAAQYVVTILAPST